MDPIKKKKHKKLGIPYWYNTNCICIRHTGNINNRTKI